MIVIIEAKEYFVKVSLVLNQEKVTNSKKELSFEGIKTVKSDKGFKNYEFGYVFDPDKEELFLEVYSVGVDKTNGRNNYFTEKRIYPKNSQNGVYQLKAGPNRVDMSRVFGIDDNTPFAYHYVLKNKETKYHETMVDAGNVLDFRNSRNDGGAIYNLHLPTTSHLSRGGSMKLVIVDSQKVGKVYNDKNIIVDDTNLIRRAQKGIKTISNRFGGTLAGLEYAVDKGEYDMFNRIISLPVFTDDDFTAHAYWNKNCMQMASSLGNINNFASLQRKMFAHGLNFVSDGAFVNEGLQGIHFKHMLKWGVESPYYNWFKAPGLKDSPLSMGVFVKNKEYISHKVVNSPYNYNQQSDGRVTISNNKDYDSKRPTYIQFFDTRLVDEADKNDKKHLIKKYAQMSLENVYSLHSHNDSVYLYSFEINPKDYNANIKRLNEYNEKAPEAQKAPLNSPLAARILSKNSTFDVEAKYESGFETWDANPDIAKLNFVYSHADTKSLKNLPKEERKAEISKLLSANYQVQDYAVTSGQFWTQKTDDILRLAIAQNLKNIDVSNPSLVYEKIAKKSNGKIFPKTLTAEVSEAEVKNVINGRYFNKRTLSKEDKKSQILEGLMNTPLDSFEFGDNLVAVLGSPLISKRATTLTDIGVSRYDLFKAGNKNLQSQYKETYEMMDKLYQNEMSDYAVKVLHAVENSGVVDKLFDGDKVTEFGKYVLPLVLPEIAKFAVVKSFAPKVKVNVDEKSGEIAYDYNALKETHLQGIGITNSGSPQDEARMVISKMRKGIKHLDVSPESDIVQSIVKSLKGTSVESFKLADLIVDKTQSGLDWRIDATKDIADVEALRNKNNNFDYTWQSIINFWKKFNQGVIAKNPNSYTVAEVTNETDLYNEGYGSYSDKFRSVNDIISKFQRETGITSIAMYSYFFSDIQKLFANIFESGTQYENDNYSDRQWMVYNMMNSFLNSGSLDYINYAYTFIGNHDKPRALHCSAIDMQKFYADLTNDKDPNYYENRLNAYKIIKDKFMDYIDPKVVENYDFSAVSSKAVAMGYALRTSAIKVLEDYKNNGKLSEPEFDAAFRAISKSVSDLVNGKYNGTRFDPDAFGIKPIDVSIAKVIKQAQKQYGLNLPPDVAKSYEDDIFQKTVEPAITRLLGMMKYLVALPGMPTLFDGDDMGATGYDTKTKNMYLQCRQRIHDEWVDEESDKYKKFIKKHKKEFDDVMKVRKMPECNALNNGTPFMLPPQHGSNGEICPAILRQSTDGRMAISIFNTTAFHNNHEADYSPQNVHLDSLNLNFEVKNDGIGGTFADRMNGKDKLGVHGIKEGTKFVNAENPNDIYYVRETNGNYYLKRHVNNHDAPIDFSNSTLILYHVPQGTPLTFTGRMDVKLPAQMIANKYSNSGLDDCGKKLALIK